MPAELEWYEVAARIGVAALLGGLIGLEREVEGHDAGFRTHLLLAVGAALFGAISVGAFDSFVTERANTNVQVDVTRVASYVAAGVGFIGGGAILKSFGVIRGITTAASLWTAAAVGLAAGVGFWTGALAATIAALIALAVLRPVSNRLNRMVGRRGALLVQVRRDASIADVVAELETVTGGSFKQIQIGQGEHSDAMEISVELWSRPRSESVHNFVEQIAAHPSVISARFGSSR